MIWLLAPPLRQSVSSTGDTQEDGERRQVARDGGGVSEEPNHTTARKPCPLLVIQYSLVRYYLSDLFQIVLVPVPAPVPVPDPDLFSTVFQQQKILPFQC
jgi:hypothetical protein